MKSIIGIIACLIGTCAAAPQDNIPFNNKLAALETFSGNEIQRPLYQGFEGKSASGNYLSGRFAQQHHDWNKAADFMNHVLSLEPSNAELIKRSMVIAMGAGDTQKALELSYQLLEMDPESSLARLFIITDAFKKEDYKLAQKTMDEMPASGVSDFVIPVLKSWAQAALGNYNASSMKDTNIHVYHAVMISDYLQNYDYLKTILEQTANIPGLPGSDMARLGDVYAHIGEKDKALKTYKDALANHPAEISIQEKIAKVESSQDPMDIEKVRTPAEGIAFALHDLAETLYQEHSDDSARVFAQMALYLNPAMTETRTLLAEISARHGHHKEAISFYQGVEPTSENYRDAQRRAAAILEDSGQTEESIRALEKLILNYRDLEAIIQLGDLYRHKEDFANALQYYNMAASSFAEGIPAQYWHLHYVRGMSYERAGKWSEAESDLKAALVFQPDHPFVLNYLGYAWADQGINLRQSLDMIRKAVSLRPEDGYITDSLGWVLYKMGNYAEAVPHLEQAVELLPYDPVMNDHLGDAYWKAGRKLEARFQWIRAKNYSEDANLIQKIDQKLATGLIADEPLRAASTQSDDVGMPIKR